MKNIFGLAILFCFALNAFALSDPAPSTRSFTVFYGGSFISRLQEAGYLEAYLQAAEPDARRQYRSLAYSGDQVHYRSRAAKFGTHLNMLLQQWKADRVVMCFGQNESFAGDAGLPAFKQHLSRYLELIRQRHPDSELILVSPIAEERADPMRNTVITHYATAMRDIATQQKIRFIDLLAPSVERRNRNKGPLTTNGMHLNARGNQAIARELAKQLAPPKTVAAIIDDTPGFLNLTTLVSRKARDVATAYHPANGVHYYGLRERAYEYNTEIPHHIYLAELIDYAIHRQAANLNSVVPLGDLPTKQAPSKNRAPRKHLGQIKTAEQDLEDFTVMDGFAVNLFASSERFAELINPLQIQFDAKGRLWVCSFASYPVPVPGTIANDTILIFEDEDGDGSADKRTVFAGGLTLPDGFVFYKDGVIAAVAGRLLFLRDTDGDDKADEETELLRGFDTTDTHHGGFLARTPQGEVIINEALFHRAQIETIYGVVHTKNAGHLFYNPATRALDLRRQLPHPNPWKISFNRWGESMQMAGGGQISDLDYYSIWTPFGTHIPSSLGMPFRDDKGSTLNFVNSPHFPDAWTDGLLTGHLLGKNQILYTPLKRDRGTWKKDGESSVLIASSNTSFRPTDMRFGLDGALYISDFYYPIIGHAQHSIRDSNRDYTHGRIWRMHRPAKPLLKKPRIAGQLLPGLFNLLAHPQSRVRELARIELENHVRSDVLAAAKTRLNAIEGHDVLALEIMWQFEKLSDYSETDYYLSLLRHPNSNVKRAAARSLVNWAPALGPKALTAATDLLNETDPSLHIAVASAVSYLRQSDPAWSHVLHGMPSAEKDAPLARVLGVLSLLDEPPLGPEFPILQIADEAYIAADAVSKTDKRRGTIWLLSDRDQELMIGFSHHSRGTIWVNDVMTINDMSVHSRGAQTTLTLNKGINKIAYDLDDLWPPPRIQIYICTSVGQKPAGLNYTADADAQTRRADAYDAVFATVSETQIYIKTVPAKMAYNVTNITVKAGRAYTFTLDNIDHMQHNLVITLPGKAATVGALADAMAAAPNAMAKAYVPDSGDIIFATPLVDPHSKSEQAFTAPAKPGIYPYICTFPGHWRIMRGVMIVEP